MKTARIVFVLSDTHEMSEEDLRRVLAEGEKRGADIYIHCGDIEAEHLKPELFHGRPVVCALTKRQIGDDGIVKKGFEEFQTPPPGWIFTRPDHRIYDLTKGESIYVGHNLSFEFLTGSEEMLDQKLHKIRNENDCVRWLFSGHTHHQICKQGKVITFINPGAASADYSFDGYEFAVINTGNGEIVFGRVPKTNPVKPTFSVGVISDSFNISELDKNIWKSLATEFRKRDVKHIIHCGNIEVCDVGRQELADFQVHFNLRDDQKCERKFDNWHQVSEDDPVVTVEGYKFCVQLDLGTTLMEKSERDMKKLCLALRRKHPGISFVLCGFTYEAFYEEGEEVRIVNPGDIVKDRNFAVICLPRTEITFGHVPV